MRYKGDYNPQYMLDPESYDWHLLDAQVKQELDKSKYLSLSARRAGKIAVETAEAADPASEGLSDPSREVDRMDEDVRCGSFFFFSFFLGRRPAALWTRPD